VSQYLYQPPVFRQADATEATTKGSGTATTEVLKSPCKLAMEQCFKRQADAELKTSLQNDLNECRKSAAVRESLCSKLESCCSESWLCDLKFQATSAFSEYVTLQHALEIERRPVSCAQTSSTTQSTTLTSTTTQSSTSTTTSAQLTTSGQAIV